MAIDEFLRQKKPDNAVVVKANWRDNPWFPAVLEEERRLDLQLYPERYAHVWEGEFATAYIDHWTEAGFECGIPIKNTGAGAAMMRIEAARCVFPRCWFNDSTTEAGRDGLGYYHERQDEKRSIGLGPEHDWSSHAADAFGYMAIAYEEPPVKSAR